MDCIVLGDTDDDDDPRQTESPEVYVRCNLCYDPGLLPVETDRSAHRRNIHADKLFYCDVCDIHERGGRGFEYFDEVVKHVSRENGIQRSDRKNLLQLIRIPRKVDHLKTFVCMFCPNEGTKFVGLPEESLLDHIRNKHSNKLAQRHPESLIKLCRICNQSFLIDLDLSDHIIKSHLTIGPENPHPFGGFGPRLESESECSSGSERLDDEDRIELVLSHLKEFNKRQKRHDETKTKRKQIKKEFQSKKRGRFSSSESSSNEKTKTEATKKSRKNCKESMKVKYRSDREPLQPSLRSRSSSPSERCIQKRPRRNDPEESASELCHICDKMVDGQLDDHLARIHPKDCFTCKKCPSASFIWFEDAKMHSTLVHTDLEPMRHVMKFPRFLIAVDCRSCRRDQRHIIGESMPSLKLKISRHMRKKHKDRDRDTRDKLLIYWCRYCCDFTGSLVELEDHLRGGHSPSPNSTTSTLHKEFHPVTVQERRSSHSDDFDKRKTGSSSSSTPRTSIRRSPTPENLNFFSDLQREPHVSSSSHRKSPQELNNGRASSTPRSGRSAKDKAEEDQPVSAANETLIGFSEYFQCKLCRRTVTDRQVFSVIQHVHSQHDIPWSECLDHIALPNVGLSIQCKHCSRCFLGTEEKVRCDLRSHRETHAGVSTSLDDCFTLHCRFCDFVCQSLGQMADMKKHVSTVHGLSPGSTKLLGIDLSLAGCFTCGYCTEELTEKRSLRHYLSKHRSQIFSCNICGVGDGSKDPVVHHRLDDSLDHIVRDHDMSRSQAVGHVKMPSAPPPAAVICPVCKLELFTVGCGIMQRHFAEAHPNDDCANMESELTCRICTKKAGFSSYALFLKHHKTNHSYVNVVNVFTDQPSQEKPKERKPKTKKKEG